MAVAVADKPTALPRASEVNNYRLSVLNGALATGGMSFFAGDTVVAGLAYTLTESPFLVGLLTTVERVGWQWPQLFIGHYVERLPRKMPVYRASAYGRLSILVLVTMALLALHPYPYVLYGALVLLLALFASAGSMCIIPFMDIVAKGVPVEWRARMFAYRNVSGGLVGFACGGAAFYVLSPSSGIPYPYSYATLFVSATVILAIAYSAFLRVEECDGVHTREPDSFGSFLRRAVTLLRKNARLRHYLVFRLIFAYGVTCRVILVPFALGTFAVPLEKTGWFAAVVALSVGLSSVLWGRMASHDGERAVLQRVAYISMVLPVFAVLLTFLDPALVGPGTWEQYVLILAVAALFAVESTASAGSVIASSAFNLRLAGPKERPLCLSIVYACNTLLMLAPAFIGTVATLYSFRTAFLSALFFGVLSVLASWRLSEPPPEPGTST